MKVVSRILFILCFSAIIAAQSSNVTLLSHLDQYSSAGYNDCWGYTDSQGREYALIGTGNGTSIVEITTPTQPVERAFIPGPSSIWRDIKTYGTYMYMVSEGGSGLQIVDLSNLPNSATLVTNNTTYFNTAHNLFIADGYAYVVGANPGSGIHILNLVNPTSPVQTAYYSASGYVHDVYVWNDTVVVCAGNSQNYHLVDVTDKANPFKISESLVLPGIYAHSGWMTEDKRYFVACEEFNVRDLTVWDLQNRTSWTLVVPSFATTSNSPIHNVFIKGHYAHISYYKDGYVVLDITDPTNPTIAGYYDTYPGNSGTYEGAWGCYPFFPSGAVIISDINTGLYVFDFLGDGVLPVEFTSFTAQATKKGIILNWTTSSQINNYGFAIERRNENKNSWEIIGLVQGNGTTTQTTNFSYNDNSVTQSGSYYYRLKQIDSDGTFNFSNEVKVDFIQPNDFILNQNFPNPFNPSTTIEFILGEDSYVKLEVYNALGEKVADLLNENKEQGSYKIKFDASKLPSGIYIAKLESVTNGKRWKQNSEYKNVFA